MTGGGLRVAVAAVRCWTRVYTWGFADAAAARRRAEIESDLWEQLNDAGRPPEPLEIVLRVLIGMPADVQWRVEHVSSERLRRSLTLAVGSGLLAATVWVGIAALPPEPPQRPAAPELRWRPQKTFPPPPPPPPPICKPSGVPGPQVTPCSPWP